MAQCKAEREAEDGTIWYCLRDDSLRHDTHIDDQNVMWTAELARLDADRG